MSNLKKIETNDIGSKEDCKEVFSTICSDVVGLSEDKVKSELGVPKTTEPDATLIVKAIVKFKLSHSLRIVFKENDKKEATEALKPIEQKPISAPTGSTGDLPF